MLVFTNTKAFTHVYISSTKHCHIQARSIRPETHLQAIGTDPPINLILAATIGAAAAATWFSGSENRAKQTQYAEWEAKEKEYQAERERRARIEPRDIWTVDDLKQYNGEEYESGPILLAVKGDVFNVWKGRNFYGEGGEYHVMAGRDATRFLAKNRLEEEREDESRLELNIAERANLEVSLEKMVLSWSTQFFYS
jgi:membrane-associated progesterone receptor component